MAEKKQLNVRIPNDLYDKIDNSGKSKPEIVIEALTLYFDNDKSQSDNNLLAIQLEEKDKQIAELHKLLDQSQQLQLHTQKLIPEDVDKKTWWQFWK
jgi:hypothetical protein